jgi:hypothetical protein
MHTTCTAGAPPSRALGSPIRNSEEKFNLGCFGSQETRRSRPPQTAPRGPTAFISHLPWHRLPAGVSLRLLAGDQSQDGSVTHRLEGDATLRRLWPRPMQVPLRAFNEKPQQSCEENKFSPNNAPCRPSTAQQIGSNRTM